jgi:hypothetical protein
MIIGSMRLYDYWKISVNEEYGQEVLPDANAEPIGKVKLSIYPTSTGTQDNILYANCSYVGLTFDAEIDEKYIIQYGKERLKVMYKQPIGRFKQVFLKRVE